MEGAAQVLEKADERKALDNIYSLEHKRAERGLASEPVQWSTEATEKQIEEALMAEAMARYQAEEGRTLKGRRVKPREKMRTEPSNTRSLWA